MREWKCTHLFPFLVSRGWKLAVSQFLNKEHVSFVKGQNFWGFLLEGSLEGGASWQSGIWENGIELDGDGDYIEVDHDSAFNLTAW